LKNQDKQEVKKMKATGRVTTSRTRLARKLSGSILIALLCYLMTSNTLLAETPTTIQEIRYHSAEAGEVFLVWGVNGWQIIPEAIRPPGTILQKNIMNTPMVREGNTFITRIQVPSGATIDYGFLITKTRNGAKVSVWEANETEDYQAVTTQDGFIEVQTTLAPGQLQANVIDINSQWPGLIFLVLGLGLVLSSPSIHARFGRSIPKYKEYVNHNITKLVLFTIISKLILLLISYLSYAVYLNPNEQYVPFSSVYLTQQMEAFGRSDVVWYVEIAQNGYESREFTVDRHASWAFYPLWPLFLKLSSVLIADMVLAGIILSTILFLLSVILLYKLISIDFSKDIAMLTAVIMVIFPSSYFGLRPGPESLFLFLAIGSLLYARQNNWVLAGVLGALATLSRLQGVLLFLPLLYIYYQQYRSTKAHAPAALGLLLIPAALLSFMVYMYWLTGNLFASFDIQQVWDNNLSYPFAAMVQFLSVPHIIHYYGFDLSLVSFVFVFFAIILTVAMVRMPHMRAEYIIYTMLSIYLIIARDTLTASLRYLMPVFPLYLILALLVYDRKTTQNLIFFTFVSLQLFYFLSFVHTYNWAAN
jgi:Gpi18-like mannosyltransferase